MSSKIGVMPVMPNVAPVSSSNGCLNSRRRSKVSVVAWSVAPESGVIRIWAASKLSVVCTICALTTPSVPEKSCRSVW